MANGLFFFAEDAFGGQFAIRGDQVVTFDPETGEVEAYASSIEDWADQLQADYEVMTGQPLAEQWQTANGGLSPGDRLVPRVPFVLGGEFEVANVYAMDAVLGMQVRGDLAVQLRRPSRRRPGHVSGRRLSLDDRARGRAPRHGPARGPRPEPGAAQPRCSRRRCGAR